MKKIVILIRVKEMKTIFGLLLATFIAFPSYSSDRFNYNVKQYQRPDGELICSYEEAPRKDRPSKVQYFLEKCKVKELTSVFVAEEKAILKIGLVFKSSSKQEALDTLDEIQAIFDSEVIFKSIHHLETNYYTEGGYYVTKASVNSFIYGENALSIFKLHKEYYIDYNESLVEDNIFEHSSISARIKSTRLKEL